MNLRVIGSNQTELEVGNFRVFFSYNTPVAYYDKKTGNAYRTCKIWSNTTSQHINSWLKSNNVPFAAQVGQEVIDKLV